MPIHIINNEIWKKYFNLKTFELDISTKENELIDRQTMQALKKLLACKKFNKSCGITFLTIPKSLSMSILNQMIESFYFSVDFKKTQFKEIDQYCHIAVKRTYRVMLTSAPLMETNILTDQIRLLDSVEAKKIGLLEAISFIFFSLIYSQSNFLFFKPQSWNTIGFEEIDLNKKESLAVGNYIGETSIWIEQIDVKKTGLIPMWKISD